jgi:hypothetical protein
MHVVKAVVGWSSPKIQTRMESVLRDLGGAYLLLIKPARDRHAGLFYFCPLAPARIGRRGRALRLCLCLCSSRGPRRISRPAPAVLSSYLVITATVLKFMR